MGHLIKTGHTATVMLRCRPDQHQQLVREAAIAGLSINSYLLQRLGFGSPAVLAQQSPRGRRSRHQPTAEELAALRDPTLPRYRDLQPGELVQADDQEFIQGQWRQVAACIVGDVYDTGIHFKVRREVKHEEHC